MATVDPDKLESVIQGAGLSERTARKLRTANTGAAPDAPRGHGPVIQKMDSPPAR